MTTILSQITIKDKSQIAYQFGSSGVRELKKQKPVFPISCVINGRDMMRAENMQRDYDIILSKKKVSPLQKAMIVAPFPSGTQKQKRKKIIINKTITLSFTV